MYLPVSVTYYSELPETIFTSADSDPSVWGFAVDSASTSLQPQSVRFCIVAAFPSTEFMQYRSLMLLHRRLYVALVMHAGIWLWPCLLFEDFVITTLSRGVSGCLWCWDHVLYCCRACHHDQCCCYSDLVNCCCPIIFLHYCILSAGMIYWFLTVYHAKHFTATCGIAIACRRLSVRLWRWCIVKGKPGGGSEMVPFERSLGSSDRLSIVTLEFFISID